MAVLEKICTSTHQWNLGISFFKSLNVRGIRDTPELIEVTIGREQLRRSTELEASVSVK